MGLKDLIRPPLDNVGQRGTTGGFYTRLPNVDSRWLPPSSLLKGGTNRIERLVDMTHNFHTSEIFGGDNGRQSWVCSSSSRIELARYIAA